MDMDFSIDSAKEFLKEVDEDGSGLLEFKEVRSDGMRYCKMCRASSLRSSLKKGAFTGSRCLTPIHPYATSTSLATRFANRFRYIF